MLGTIRYAKLANSFPTWDKLILIKITAMPLFGNKSKYVFYYRLIFNQILYQNMAKTITKSGKTLRPSHLLARLPLHERITHIHFTILNQIFYQNLSPKLFPSPVKNHDPPNNSPIIKCVSLPLLATHWVRRRVTHSVSACPCLFCILYLWDSIKWNWLLLLLFCVCRTGLFFPDARLPSSSPRYPSSFPSCLSIHPPGSAPPYK